MCSGKIFVEIIAITVQKKVVLSGAFINRCKRYTVRSPLSIQLVRSSLATLHTLCSSLSIQFALSPVTFHTLRSRHFPYSSLVHSSLSIQFARHFLYSSLVTFHTVSSFASHLPYRSLVTFHTDRSSFPNNLLVILHTVR